MGRAKIKMERINDNKIRNITFTRRKDCVLKKARELGTLCGVDVSVIMFSDHQQDVEIFPQDPIYLNDMIKNYKSYGGRIKSSSNTNVDNGYHPVMLMGQEIRSYDHDKRSMQSLDSKSLATTSEDDDGSYDGVNSGLQPEVLQQLEQPQCMDLLSCFRD
ncbi:transcription factor, MADS-box [Artemisia annua]|uniref:Transcription factor, MADS-box n=1 Tax=Artemisia annua TaxID=35608 RepID=A0A2U1KCS0_ARTAN|nr:transcription factor, MADS-box [Artemisia annua]